MRLTMGYDELVERARAMLACAAGATDTWRWIRGQFGAVASDHAR
jgi:hypothetical protein